MNTAFVSPNWHGTRASPRLAQMEIFLSFPLCEPKGQELCVTAGLGSGLRGVRSVDEATNEKRI
jgi:hypothetical protein